MADLKSIIKGLDSNVQKVNSKADSAVKEVSKLGYDLDQIEQVVAVRLENVEGAVFALITAQIEQIKAAAEAVTDPEQSEQLFTVAANLAGIQSVIAPSLFARTYRVNPETNERLDDEGLAEFLAQPRQVERYDDLEPDEEV